jgi:orotidine-5'-phosphate decarboxylase
MLVAGATGPAEARVLRELAPEALFLVPGYGAQGAGVDEALAGFVDGPHGLEGGVVSASRSVSFPAAAQTASSFAEWQAAIADAIDTAQADLKAATQA